MNIIGICVIAVVGAILALTLKSTTPHISLIIVLAAGIIIFISILFFMPQVIIKVKNLISFTGMDESYAVVLFKSLGICFLCQFATDACKDAGQSSLASKVELAGKLMIVTLSLPLIESIINTAANLIGG